ncbi:MAG: FG-GAP repeat protein, partial [Thermoplasmata archaeon]|nr:FG-GAP repeat protein [Thermoplasmata archaeon]
GSRTSPEITGEDYLNIFVDIDGALGGYGIGPIYADYLLSVRGKNSEITYIEFLEYDGSGMEWEWKSSGKQVAASIDSRRLEAYADMTLLGGNRFEIIYEASDWKEEADFATNLSWNGRSATRGSYGEYGARFSSGSYDAYLTDLADKVSFNRRDNQLSWTLPREIRWNDGTGFEVLGELIPSSLVLERDGVTYSDAYSNLEVSIEYIFEENGLKENIILEREIEGIGEHGDLSFLTPLQYTDGLMIQANGKETGEWTAVEGGLTFKERDTTAFHIASPYSVDTNGDVLDCYYLYSSAERLLDLRCPSNWFATATYPVLIDPSVFTLENDDATLGQAEEYLGWSTAIGDFDDDGYADIATGAPYADIGSNADAGAVYIYYGPFSGDDASPDVMIAANNTGAHLGWAIGAGIFNTDTYWDLIVTQLDNDAYVYYGSSSWSGWETTPDVT